MILTGCAGPKGIDPAFDSTLETLKSDFAAAGTDVPVRSVSIQFGDTSWGGENANAICFTFPSRYIVVKKEYWDQLDQIYQEYLLAHEIGHCILNRSHDSGFTQLELFMPSVPKTIMNPDAGEAANWDQRYHDYYMQELVSGWSKEN